VIRDELRSLWAEPPAPDPPVRVWRDWALLAACLTAITGEGALRPDLTWRPIGVLVSLVIAVATLWRRTRPLLVLASAFGLCIVVTTAGVAAGHPSDSTGLYADMVVLVLIYALLRWGSGRQIVLGTVLVVAAVAASMLLADTPVSEALAGTVFVSFPGVLGAFVRYRVTSRRRELERMRSREREQLARELHDTVAHHVSAMVIRAQAGRVVTGTDPSAAVEALAGIEEEGARTLEAMRTMVGALREADARADLTPQAGVADLERLARTPDGSLRVEIWLDGPLDGLPPAVDAAVYRIVQEAVTNAMRHAVDADQVTVRVGGMGDRVHVEVRDDGSPPGRAREGFGLTGLHERAALLGGSLEAGPAPDRGWLVEADLPFGTSPKAG
jgi:signal transduction histidine kinase